MRKLRYHLIDVFTNQPFGGNQLAVFSNGRGVSEDLMQGIAAELNISETTFVMPPQDSNNDFWVRIFSPTIELPMAGHPTIGTAFVLAHENLIDRSLDENVVIFEEGIGPVSVTIRCVDGEPVMATMSQTVPEIGARFEDRNALAEMLTIDPTDIDADYPAEVVSSGIPYLLVPLKNLQAMRSIKFRVDIWEQALKDLDSPNVFIFTTETELEGSTVHSRMFAPGMGILEDAATGGAGGPLGSYLVRYGLVNRADSASIISEQGFEIGRPSLIHIEVDFEGDQIKDVQVGGQCAFIGEGTIEIDE